MTLPVADDLKAVAEAILRENKTDAEWSALESDDMFQKDTIHGGYDATEQAFCFSYFEPNGSEFWFQLTLEEINGIARGTKEFIDVRPAE